MHSPNLCGKRSGKPRVSQPRVIQSDSEVDMRGFGGDGMSTEDEREDLARNPLPEIVPKEYRCERNSHVGLQR